MTLFDLSDYEVEVRLYDLIFEYPGRSGSWYEPAEPPVREYLILTIAIVDLKDWEVDNIYGIKPGDLVTLNFSWTVDDDPHQIPIEVREEALEVRSVHVSDDKDEVLLGVNRYCEWRGHPPPQSFAGRG